jgi:hypothetical protein
MRARLFTIKDNTAQRSVMADCWDFVSQAIQSGSLDVTVAQASKTRQQEKMYHCMMGDISKQVELDGKKYIPKVWKVKLKDQFEHELIALGTPLSKPGSVTMSIDGLRVVQIPPESKEFRKGEASDFIEYLFSFGAEMNICWTDPETQSMYKDYWEREANG